MVDYQTHRAALPDTIETGRLMLRAPELSDVPAMATLANNRKIHEMLSRLPHPYSEADALAFVSSIARTRTEHAYSILERKDGFTGVVSLIFADGNAPEIGYWLGEPHWGRGIGTEATGAVLGALLARGPCPVIARARAENLGSRRVLEKLGFVLVEIATATCGPHKDIPVARYTLPATIAGAA